MILEGVVTTLDSSGVLNIAPMGPRLIQGFDRFLLRPFRTSTTYRNLKIKGEGVLHVTDDVLLIAKAAIGEAVDAPNRPASQVEGRVLLDSCRYYEFRIIQQDETPERADFLAETVEMGRLRDFLGFNRAKHAVIEAAILATRVNLLPVATIINEFKKLKVIVSKTAGPAETEAFLLLETYIQKQRSLVPVKGSTRS